MTPQQQDALRTKIGQNIRDICLELYGPRKEHKMAKDLKMSQGSFSDILNGKSFPSCLTLVKLAKLMEKKGNIQNNINAYNLIEILEV